MEFPQRPFYSSCLLPVNIASPCSHQLTIKSKADQQPQPTIYTFPFREVNHPLKLLKLLARLLADLRTIKRFFFFFVSRLFDPN